jgi:uncharacterized RDD family membrane protein YckC
MSDAPTPQQPAGWYHAEGDPPGSVRYWDGSRWLGLPQSGPGRVPAASDLASPWQRIAARLIDSLILAVVQVLWISVFVVAVFSGAPIGGDTSQDAVIMLPWFGAAVYELVTVALWGGTLGKLMVGLRVTRADGRRPIGWARSIRRAALHFAVLIPLVGPFIFFGSALVSLVLLFTDSERRTIWDRVGDTRVRKV